MHFPWLFSPKELFASGDLHCFPLHPASTTGTKGFLIANVKKLIQWQFYKPNCTSYLNNLLRMLSWTDPMANQHNPVRVHMSCKATCCRTQVLQVGKTQPALLRGLPAVRTQVSCVNSQTQQGLKQFDRYHTSVWMFSEYSSCLHDCSYWTQDGMVLHWKWQQRQEPWGVSSSMHRHPFFPSPESPYKHWWFYFM